MASVASDPDRDYGTLSHSDPLLDVVASIEDIIYDVSRVEWRCGVDPVEEINLSAAAAGRTLGRRDVVGRPRKAYAVPTKATSSGFFPAPARRCSRSHI
jgi:hypothetical protein